MIQVKVTCPECRKQRWIKVDKAGYEAWRNGELIQYAMPYLSISDREALISGWCDICWDTFLGFDQFEEEFDNV